MDIVHGLRSEFLDELRVVQNHCLDALLIYNLIYQAADKNNDRLNLRTTCHFRLTINDPGIIELYLHGRLYTWSNERRRLTMERIDHEFATVHWFEAFVNHHLKALSTDSSDHAPLLLQLCTEPWTKPRFRFEPFWVRMDGFEDTVRQAWDCNVHNIDACRTLDT